MNDKRSNARLGLKLPVGSPRAMCPACREVCRSVSGFDAHRKGKPGSRYCVHPSEVGLRLNSQQLWAQPMAAEVIARRKAAA